MMKRLTLACGLVAMVAGAGTVRTGAAGAQSFLTLQPGFTQALVGVTPLGTDVDAGLSVSSLNDVVSRINQNYDGGTTNNGFLAP
jgi:hypothetical protein